jgi:hypothetical protein
VKPDIETDYRTYGTPDQFLKKKIYDYYDFYNYQDYDFRPKNETCKADWL